MLGLPLGASAVARFLFLLLIGTCLSQEAELLPWEVMDLVVMAANVSDVIYSGKKAELLADENPIPVKTWVCTDDANNTVCKEEVSLRVGLFIQASEKTITARIGNACVLAFRGSSLRHLEWWNEWKTNFDLGQVTVERHCTVTRGIRDAYLTDNVGYVEDDMHMCLSSCPECSLVITGHGQGGAIANVAGVLFESYGYSPYVITFGQPKVLGGRCQVNSAKWFRFILAEPGLLRLRYDVVPMLPGTGTFYGHEILVSRDDLTGVEYYGLDKHEIKGAVSTAAHRRSNYLYSLYKIRENGFPIRTTGFRNGSRCSKDHECSSGKCAWRWLRGNRCK